MKDSYKKRKHSRKILTTISIIVVALIFVYCVLCLIAKVIPDTDITTTAESSIPDEETATTTASFTTTFKKILVLEDFAYTALGAMFGFGASLILENYILNYSKKKAFTNLVDEIIQIIIQLGDLRQNILKPITEIPVVNGKVDRLNIEKRKDDLSRTFRSVKYYKDTVYFPIWESILQNGDLLFFREENYFCSLIKVYTRLIKIKHMIDDQNVDETNLEDIYYFLLYLDLNIKEFLTLNNDFEESLIKAIDSVNQREDNCNYKIYFEVKNE